MMTERDTPDSRQVSVLRAAWLLVYVPIVVVEVTALVAGALDPTPDGLLRPHAGPYAAALVALQAVVLMWLLVNSSLAAARITNPVNVYLSVGTMLWAAFVLPEMERVASHDGWGILRLMQWSGGAFLVPHLLWFPDGRFVPRWSRLIVPVWLAVWAATALVLPGGQGLLGLAPARLLFGFFVVLIGFGCQLFRLQITQDALVRQQLKWIIAGEVFHYIGALAIVAARLIGGDVPILLRADVVLPAYVLSPAAVTAAYNVAIFRYRLWDIDLIVNRTIVYGSATIALVVSFVFISRIAEVALAAALPAMPDVSTLPIAVAVAAAFPWLQRRIRPFVDRFLPAREVLTVLFTDIVGSTQLAASLGDERWRGLLARYRTAVRKTLRQFKGEEVDTAGDGFFATFRSPRQAVRCGFAFTSNLADLGIRVRTGIHQGACEMRGEKITGMTIHIAARIVTLAQYDEILVSRSVRDAFSDKHIRFETRGDHALRGVPGVWTLYAARAQE